MISPEIVTQRLLKIRDNLRKLEPVRQLGFEEFISNGLVYDGILHALQTSVQAVMDICQYLVSEEQLDAPNEQKDLVQSLAKTGVFPKEFLEKVTAMIGMRNVIVHEYIRVDNQKIYDVLKHHLNDFDEFAQYVVAYLEKEGLV